jgi:hypothetical protein
MIRLWRGIILLFIFEGVEGVGKKSLWCGE